MKILTCVRRCTPHTRASKLRIWTSKIMPDLDLFCPIKKKFHTPPYCDTVPSSMMCLYLCLICLNDKNTLTPASSSSLRPQEQSLQAFFFPKWYTKINNLIFKEIICVTGTLLQQSVQRYWFMVAPVHLPRLFQYQALICYQQLSLLGTKCYHSRHLNQGCRSRSRPFQLEPEPFFVRLRLLLLLLLYSTVNNLFLRDPNCDYKQCCGSKYIEFGFGSGSRILAQFGSKVTRSILKEKILNNFREK